MSLWLALAFPAGVLAQPWTGSSEPSHGNVVARAEADPRVIGPLRLGCSEAQVQEALGAPERVTPRAMMRVSEELSYTWDYPTAGVTVVFSCYDQATPGTVMAVRAMAPCAWTAFGGLKVGMSIDAASAILRRRPGENVTPIGSVGTEMAGFQFELLDLAVVARLHMGVVSVLYVGPYLP